MFSASPEPLELARHAIDAIVDIKGEDVLLLDLRNLTVMTDYFVIGTANSDRQLNAMAMRVRETVKENQRVIPTQVEGRGEDGWILMDYGSVIVHLFLPDTRRYYDLEGFWKEAPVLVKIQ
jgi:ribosome silencing factor RsfS/YbeB/iojap